MPIRRKERSSEGSSDERLLYARGWTLLIKAGMGRKKLLVRDVNRDGSSACGGQKAVKPDGLVEVIDAEQCHLRPPRL